MKNLHTPGPWAISQIGNEYSIIDAPSTDGKCGKDWNYIAQISIRDTLPPGSHNGVERIANARLIAAAPETASERDKLKELNAELLEALEELLDVSVFGTGHERVNAHNKAGIIIAKAKGQ